MAPRLVCLGDGWLFLGCSMQSFTLVSWLWQALNHHSLIHYPAKGNLFLDWWSFLVFLAKFSSYPLWGILSFLSHCENHLNDPGAQALEDKIRKGNVLFLNYFSALPYSWCKAMSVGQNRCWTGDRQRGRTARWKKKILKNMHIFITSLVIRYSQKKITRSMAMSFQRKGGKSFF